VVRSAAIAAIASVPFWVMASDWSDWSEARATAIGVIVVAAINGVVQLAKAAGKAT